MIKNLNRVFLINGIGSGYQKPGDPKGARRPRPHPIHHETIRPNANDKEMNAMIHNTLITRPIVSSSRMAALDIRPTVTPVIP